jgi:hypothetical protein
MTQTDAVEKGRPKRRVRRSRRANDENQGNAKIFSVRLDPDLRAALELAAEQRGWSLGRELQSRVRQALVEEEKLADQFGSYREALIWRVVAALVRAVRNPRNPEAEWLDDANTFDLAYSALHAYLFSIRPKRRAGQRPVTTKDKIGTMLVGRRLAFAIWRADPTLPLTASGMQAVANLMKNRLPEIVNRVESDPFGAPHRARKSPSKKSRKLKGA